MPENEAKKVGVTLARKGAGTNVSTVSVVLKTTLKLMSAAFLIQVNISESGVRMFYIIKSGST